jgi:hypothetical protein
VCRLIESVPENGPMAILKKSGKKALKVIKHEGF